jgi:cell division septal protein FtsQ
MRRDDGQTRRGPLGAAGRVRGGRRSGAASVVTKAGARAPKNKRTRKAPGQLAALWDAIRARLRGRAGEALPTPELASEPPVQAPKRSLADAFARVPLGAVGVLVGAAVLGGAVELGRQALARSERFAIERVEVRGQARLREDEVVAASGVALGDNLFALDPARVERQLEDHGWIARAAVARRWPRGLELTVTERVARAVVATRDGLRYVDSDGRAFAPRLAGDPELLPLVTPSSEADAAQVASALEALETFDAVVGDQLPMPAEGPRVGEVHVAPDGSIALVLAEGGQRVELGKPRDDTEPRSLAEPIAPAEPVDPRGRWAPAIERYLAVERQLAERGFRATELRVGGRDPHRVVARLEGRRDDTKNQKQGRGHGPTATE